jgi:hypothetical protein
MIWQCFDRFILQVLRFRERVFMRWLLVRMPGTQEEITAVCSAFLHEMQGLANAVRRWTNRNEILCEYWPSLIRLSESPLLTSISTHKLLRSSDRNLYLGGCDRFKYVD